MVLWWSAVSDKENISGEGVAVFGSRLDIGQLGAWGTIHTFNSRGWWVCLNHLCTVFVSKCLLFNLRTPPTIYSMYVQLFQVTITIISTVTDSWEKVVCRLLDWAILPRASGGLSNDTFCFCLMIPVWKCIVTSLLWGSWDAHVKRHNQVNSARDLSMHSTGLLVPLPPQGALPTSVFQSTTWSLLIPSILRFIFILWGYDSPLIIHI